MSRPVSNDDASLLRAEAGGGFRVKPTPRGLIRRGASPAIDQVNRRVGSHPRHPHHPPRAPRGNSATTAMAAKAANHGGGQPADVDVDVPAATTLRTTGAAGQTQVTATNPETQSLTAARASIRTTSGNTPVQPPTTTSAPGTTPAPSTVGSSYGYTYNTGNTGTNSGAVRTIPPHASLARSIGLDAKTQGNQPGFLLTVVTSLIFRQNDVYLSSSDVDNLAGRQNFQTSPQTARAATNSLATEVKQLIQNLINQIAVSLRGAQNINDDIVYQIVSELSRQNGDQIRAAKNSILNSADLNAKQFQNLNIRERMEVSVGLLFRHLPAVAEGLHAHETREILNGLLLARGLVVAGETAADVRNFISLKSSILPAEFSPAALRDVGQLVKILITDAAGAKTTANLDLAVQKFVRILITNNELETLLAAIGLAAQAGAKNGSGSRSLALVQIYQLANRLLLAGEKAMKEATAQPVLSNALQKNERGDILTLGRTGLLENDEQNVGYHRQGNGAESSLRQFLEFNPAFVCENSLSAFVDPDDARQAQNDFVSLYQTDIEQWLRSGNHRFVKDIDFEKPLGIVVERETDGYFAASKARVVLVRDGSVQGWHFLKSLLVR